MSQANSIQTVTSRVRVNSSGGAKNEFIDAKIRAKCLIISQSCIPAITLEAAALTPTAGSCTIGLTLIPSHSGLRSESISWPVSPTLDNLVGEHASPTLTAFSVMNAYEILRARIIADRLHAEGWSYGIAEHFTKHGLLFCVDAHRDGKRFIVKADDLLTAFLSLERDAIAPKGANGNATRPNVA